MFILVTINPYFGSNSPLSYVTSKIKVDSNGNLLSKTTRTSSSYKDAVTYDNSELTNLQNIVTQFNQVNKFKKEMWIMDLDNVIEQSKPWQEKRVEDTIVINLD